MRPSRKIVSYVDYFGDSTQSPYWTSSLSRDQNTLGAALTLSSIMLHQILFSYRIIEISLNSIFNNTFYASVTEEFCLAFFLLDLKK